MAGIFGEDGLAFLVVAVVIHLVTRFGNQPTLIVHTYTASAHHTGRKQGAMDMGHENPE